MVRIEKIRNGYLLYLPESYSINTVEGMSEALAEAKRKIDSDELYGVEHLDNSDYMRRKEMNSPFYVVNAHYYPDEIELLQGLQSLLIVH